MRPRADSVRCFCAHSDWGPRRPARTVVSNLASAVLRAGGLDGPRTHGAAVNAVAFAQESPARREGLG